MRLVAHPVAIITSSESSRRAPIDHHWRGATVSSFNTVTFTPYPVVSFNIKRQSATFKAIESSGSFNVHLLRDTKEAEMLADTFAAGNDARPFHDDDGELRQFAQGDDAIGEVEGVQKERGDVDERVFPPIIRFQAQQGSEEYTTFRIQCEYMSGKTAEIGDHVVVFGKVTSVDQHSQLQTENGSRLCLLYVDRAYGRVST
jgi:flavin reductase (DIM6/NTAB) family NADH-FMN oxidoreductase RutF